MCGADVGFETDVRLTSVVERLNQIQCCEWTSEGKAAGGQFVVVAPKSIPRRTYLLERLITLLQSKASFIPEASYIWD